MQRSEVDINKIVYVSGRQNFLKIPEILLDLCRQGSNLIKRFTDLLFIRKMLSFM